MVLTLYTQSTASHHATLTVEYNVWQEFKSGNDVWQVWRSPTSETYTPHSFHESKIETAQDTSPHRFSCTNLLRWKKCVVIARRRVMRSAAPVERRPVIDNVADTDQFTNMSLPLPAFPSSVLAYRTLSSSDQTNEQMRVRKRISSTM